MSAVQRTPDRDAVAVSIESFLHQEATLGRGKLTMNSEADGVRVTFGVTTVRAENYDIAFVRLARTLLDDARFAEPLLVLLRNAFASQN